MTRFRQYFENFIFQSGVSCARYIPHRMHARCRLNAVWRKNRRKEGVADE